MTNLFGAYQLRARVQPLLLAAFPAAVLVYALGTSDEIIGRTSAAITTFGVTTVLVAFARDRGHRLQADLWNTWGGPPTTTMLLSKSTAPSPNLETHRRHVRRLLPDAEPLSDERDSADPIGSALTIEQYITHLRERTRDPQRFPIVFDANVGYGFRRNTLGLRVIGIAIASLTTIGSATALLLVRLNELDRPAPVLALAMAVGLLALALWMRASSEWVRVEANRYAQALLSAAEAIEPPAATVNI